MQFSKKYSSIILENEATRYLIVLRGGALLYIVRKVNCMTTEQAFKKFGFVKEDIGLYLNKMSLLKNSVKLKEIHIDVYPESPFVSSSCFSLILRASEKNAMISVEGDRIIFKKNDAYETHFVNVLASKVIECFAKISDGCYEFILNVQNIYYKITILN